MAPGIIMALCVTESWKNVKTWSRKSCDPIPLTFISPPPLTSFFEKFTSAYILSADGEIDKQYLTVELK